VTLAVCLFVAATALQSSSPQWAIADRYEPLFDELQRIAPRGDRVATVRNVVLRRDAIEFHLEQGHLYLFTPLADRTVAAVFLGRGSVSFAPPVEVEHGQLKHVLGDSTLDAPIFSAAFVFADSTPAELEHKLTFGSGGGANEAQGPASQALDHLTEGQGRYVHPALMAALLNGDVNGFFFAYVKRAQGEDLMFEIDPEKGEQVLLLRGGRLTDQKVQAVCQFPTAADLGDSVPVADAERDPLKLESYRIETTVAGNLDFSARATIRFTPRRDRVRWVRFVLFADLTVDSVVDGTGAADIFFRARRHPELWVRLPRVLKAGEADSIRVLYHGDLIAYGSLFRIRGNPHRPPLLMDRWLFMRDPSTWFPRIGDPSYGGLQAGDMDLTFHTPSRYRFVSVGRLLDSRVETGVLTTRWVTERPATVASFNLGDFEETQITDPRIPPVTLQVNVDGHRALRSMPIFAGGGLNPQEDVSVDLANSLAFFSQAYGPPLFQRYYATEIPYPYGEAFPGLIYLSVGTFQTIDESGAEETFRSHEMAHQWWGIGVDPATYRDAWLSEGFAEFSGLWYTQVILNDNEKFFKQLDDRRRVIRAKRGDEAPIGLGTRLAEMDHPEDYSIMVYGKGAWVLQMLRNMMIDFRTMREDAFTSMMQDFYKQYRGRRASTRDFQRVVEQHVQLPMDWFFDEWIDGTAIPTYILSWHAEPEPDHRYLLKLRIRQEDAPKAFVMPVPLTIQFDGGGRVTIRVTVRGPVTETELRVPAEPKQLELNPLSSVLAEVKQEGWH
jgi:Peptidase family M1 domain